MNVVDGQQSIVSILDSCLFGSRNDLETLVAILKSKGVLNCLTQILANVNGKLPWLGGHCPLMNVNMDGTKGNVNNVDENVRGHNYIEVQCQKSECRHPVHRPLAKITHIYSENAYRYVVTPFDKFNKSLKKMVIGGSMRLERFFLQKFGV